MYQDTTIEETIQNLEKASEFLQSYANNPKIYNTEYAYYIDIMAYDVRRQANDLKECRFMHG